MISRRTTEVHAKLAEKRKGGRWMADGGWTNGRVIGYGDQGSSDRRPRAFGTDL